MMCKSSPGKQGILYSIFVQTESMVIWTKVYELHTLRESSGNARFDIFYSHSNYSRVNYFITSATTHFKPNLFFQFRTPACSLLLSKEKNTSAVNAVN
jgi:hypothetical protein